ncbi:G-protein coupled receptor 37-like 1 [Corythoichthys intestinalis]|uniref:G-protein coupled receptor 37-like 1 n=1 Tax=Corythoichthys intestinalis TaxID=161448 RepID=UPI0025A650A5|nr:G-protein coupled receptor 37-like 1 [Corythoichthys intestinalis]XP_061803520.1 G-protein coupled receptor 37-like 1 [Nerophis lumbriciformis]
MAQSVTTVLVLFLWQMFAATRALSEPHVYKDLDLEQHRRLARGAEEDEQQSTYSQSFENDSVTPPQVTQLSNVTDSEDRGIFNPFYPLSRNSYIAYATVLAAGLLLAVGVVGNMAIMCIVWNNFYMRSAWNYLLASVAFWDFLLLLLCLPTEMANWLSHRRIMPEITCRLVPYMEVVSLGVTSFTLCALGIDRFHAATSSSQPKTRRVERCRSVLVKLVVVWVAAMLLASPELFLWHQARPTAPTAIDSCSISVSSPSSLLLPDSLHSLLHKYHQARMWWTFGCYFCLPVLFTILCQMATRNVHSDSSSAHKQRSHDDPSSNHKRHHHQALERQLNCTLLALALVYSICALPQHICNIMLAYTNITISEDTEATLALLHHFLLFLKSSITPVVLLCLCKALGRVFVDCCCCCCRACQQNSVEGSPGSAHVQLKTAKEAAIFFDKAKDTSAILSISS